MRRVLIATFMILALAGCVQPTTPQQAAQIKSLIIVTGFGEQIEWNFGGLASFANRDSKPTVDWQIDGYFKQVAASLLNKRYELRSVAYDPASTLQGRDLFADPAIATVTSVVRPGAADAILYFGPYAFVDRSDRSVYGNGLGFLRHSSLVSRDDIAFTMWRAVVFDGKSLAILGQAAALLPQDFDLIYLRSRPRTPRIGSSFPIPERYEDLSPSQRQMAKDMIFTLVSRHMPQVLSELNLR